MNRPLAKPTTERAHPLLFDCCRCGVGRVMACLYCKRWANHQSIVEQRRRAWGKWV